MFKNVEVIATLVAVDNFSKRLMKMIGSKVLSTVGSSSFIFCCLRWLRSARAWRPLGTAGSFLWWAGGELLCWTPTRPATSANHPRIIGIGTAIEREPVKFFIDTRKNYTSLLFKLLSLRMSSSNFMKVGTGVYPWEYNRQTDKLTLVFIKFVGM